ncbi:sensor histidine kinase [Pseudonocardia acaciae]|uniref:sensor histidine kinase n=1 Tax=Pseudonocardia acaciae TaxID=551276 RepID=UPI00048E5EA2|nr:histidine kinase [Pseudonocardia acaciae]
MLAARVTDPVLAAGVGIVVVLGTLPQLRGLADLTGHRALAWALIAAACAALCVRRRYPVAVAAVTLVAALAYYPSDVPDGPIVLAFVVALYTAAARGRLAASGALAAVALIATGAGELAASTPPLGAAAVSLLAGWLVAAVTMGALARNAELRERQRIAGELHDVLGHGVSLINVQAGAALHRMGDDVEPARAALESIKQTSRHALRASLGVLHDTDRPGLAELTALVERARRAGLTVVATIDDRPVPDEPARAAYRIVQESLTNVARHAPGATATVRVTVTTDALLVTVEDDGTAEHPVTEGTGIRGMRLRATALGGALDVARTPSGGVQVSARLPHPPA